MRKILKFLISRLAITCFFILIQLSMLFIAMLAFTSTFIYFYFIMLIFSMFLIIAIINDDSNPTFKMAWIIPMLIFPIFGAPLYVIFGRKTVSKRIIKQLNFNFTTFNEILPHNDTLLESLQADNACIYKQFNYIFNTTKNTVYTKTKTEFLATGEIFYKNILAELEKAERFIFLEYFIIDKGEMWDTILEILKSKAMQGVDVRLLYDDFGTINLLEKNYPKYLNSIGIKTCIFNPFHASLDSFLNYRDHRKITIIDGNVGFVGGINLADEYINFIERFGHWKDSSVMIKGDAVSSLTVMFLQLWYFANNSDEQEYKNFFNTVSYDLFNLSRIALSVGI